MYILKLDKALKIDKVLMHFFCAYICYCMLQVDSDFSVCVVVPVGDELTEYSTADLPTPPAFLYHRLNLQPDTQYCKQFFRKAVKGEGNISCPLHLC